MSALPYACPGCRAPLGPSRARRDGTIHCPECDLVIAPERDDDDADGAIQSKPGAAYPAAWGAWEVSRDDDDRPARRPARKARRPSRRLAGLVGAGVVLGLLLIGAGVAALWHFPIGPGKRVQFGAGEEVYYTRGVTEAEARRVGGVLQKVRYFDGTGAKTVQVRKEGGTFVVALVVRDGAWNDPAAAHACSVIGGEIARDALDGRPVVVELCDKFMKTRKTLQPIDHGKQIAFGGGEEVLYTKGVTEDEARRVGNVLKTLGYFDGTRAKTVQVRKEGDAFVVAIVIRDGMWDAPDVIQEFSAIRRPLSREAFGGRPVVVELCDEFLKARKTIR